MEAYRKEAYGRAIKQDQRLQNGRVWKQVGGLDWDQMRGGLER